MTLANTFAVIRAANRKTVSAAKLTKSRGVEYIFGGVFLIDRVIEQIGGKQLAMTLLTHEDANVRYQALLAVQKMMVQNW